MTHTRRRFCDGRPGGWPPVHWPPARSSLAPVAASDRDSLPREVVELLVDHERPGRASHLVRHGKAGLCQRKLPLEHFEGSARSGRWGPWMQEDTNTSKHAWSPDSTEGLPAKTPENSALDHDRTLHLAAKAVAAAKPTCASPLWTAARVVTEREARLV